MSHEVTDEHRAYIDRSAQTSPALDVTSSVLELPRLDVPTADLSSVSVLLQGLKVSEPTAQRPLTHHEDLAEKPPAFDSTLRFLKRAHLPERRPSSTSMTLTTATTRIVSLPETVSEYSEKQVLRQTNKKRVVSMPIKQDKLATEGAQADDNPESELSMENILPDHDRPSRIRVFSHTTDAPHTPSPPSSPESIVIIGSESQISERFIRGSACAESESPYSSGSSDDDWVNWARSPPRPIPALHGPSSLPYARCPSGAEGTIIEGQQHLPQMIWGLESEDSGRARSEPPAAPPSAPIAPSGRQTVSKPSSHNAQAKVPPRFSKPAPLPRTERQPPVTNPAAYVSFAETLPRVPQSGFNDPHALADYSNFTVPAHGPIDLNLLARPRSAIGLYPVPQGSEFSSNSAYTTSGLHANGDREDLDAGWQAYPAEHDVLGSSLYSRSYGYGGADNTFQPLSSSYSVSSLSSAGTPHIMELPSQQGYSARGNSYPYSPLSTQSTPLHTPATVHQVSQRMSALEIAQKYRQKQLLQTQPSASLPTPPSSTSPLWSSGFSPYQESMWSPDVRSTGSWATASLSLASSQNRLPTPHSTGQPAARTQPPARPTVSGAVDHGSRHRSTLPIGVDSLARRVSDQPFSSNAIDLALLHTARGSTQGERRSVRPNMRASPVTGPQMSPVAPKPPPNTPLQSLMKQPTYTRPRANLTVPLSPTSPDLSSLAASRQHPRSIPLNRLIQRRLSSVAEEGRPSPEQKKPPLPPLPWCEKPGTPAPRFSTPVIINADGTLSIAPRAARPPPPAYTSTDEASTSSTSLKQHAAAVTTTTRPNAKQGRPPNATTRIRQHTDGGANVINNSEQSQKNKARARNVKRGRHQTNGPERVDGGLTVHS